MKAISPMIAVILLIAFTVAIGTILSVWFPTLTRIAMGPTETLAGKVTRCAPASIKIEEVSSNHVKVTNPFSLNITNITLVLDGTELSQTGDLAILKAYSTTTYPIYRGTNTTLAVRGLCLNEILKEDRCSQGEICWK